LRIDQALAPDPVLVRFLPAAVHHLGIYRTSLTFPAAAELLIRVGHRLAQAAQVLVQA